MKRNIQEIPLNIYLTKRKTIPYQNEQSFFDLLFTTGARVSEALAIKKRDFNLEEKTVNLYTEKNPLDPYRKVRLCPFSGPATEIIESITSFVKPLNDDEKVWSFTRKRIWLLSNRYFGVTDHSFRHTNAIMCAMRPISLNAPELCARFGWHKFSSAENYLRYGFQESIDKKMGVVEKAKSSVSLTANHPQPYEVPT